MLADAKVMADNAQIAARNLADVSGQGGGGVSGGSSQAGIGQAGIGQADSSLGEKVGIAFFFVLLAIALLIWWFQFGRGGDLSGGLAAGPSTYGTASFGRVGSTAWHHWVMWQRERGCFARGINGRQPPLHFLTPNPRRCSSLFRYFKDQ